MAKQQNSGAHQKNNKTFKSLACNIIVYCGYITKILKFRNRCNYTIQSCTNKYIVFLKEKTRKQTKQNKTTNKNTNQRNKKDQPNKKNIKMENLDIFKVQLYLLI